LRRFIPNFAEIVKILTNMLKKCNKVKWNAKEKSSFQQIKKALGEVPVLVSPNYSKEFLVFSFAFKSTIVVVLLQNNDENFEQPISFFIKILWDS
jgi:hypothetical protein